MLYGLQHHQPVTSFQFDPPFPATAVNPPLYFHLLALQAVQLFCLKAMTVFWINHYLDHIIQDEPPVPAGLDGSDSTLQPFKPSVLHIPGSDGGNTGLAPESPLLFDSQLLGAGKTVCQGQVGRHCNMVGQPLFEQDLFETFSSLIEQVGEYSTIAIMGLPVRQQVQLRGSLDQTAQPVTGLSGKRLIRLPITARFCGIDTDQSNFATIVQFDSIAVIDMSDGNLLQRGERLAA